MSLTSYHEVFESVVLRYAPWRSLCSAERVVDGQQAVRGRGRVLKRYVTSQPSKPSIRRSERHEPLGEYSKYRLLPVYGDEYAFKLYSTFLICSFIFSNSFFIATTHSVSVLSLDLLPMVFISLFIS